ncbi:MAG: hypothetical protein ACX94A_06685, partial [Algiphilus sp.]
AEQLKLRFKCEETAGQGLERHYSVEARELYVAPLSERAGDALLVMLAFGGGADGAGSERKEITCSDPLTRWVDEALDWVESKLSSVPWADGVTG